MLYRSKTLRVLLPGELHRHALRDAAADHVSDDCAPEIVRDPTGTAGGDRGGFPGLVERDDPPR